MQHLDIDWAELARRADVWCGLRPSVRACLLRVKPTETIPRVKLGDDFDTLRTARFVQQISTGRISLHPSHTSFARALRAMHRHDVLDHPTQATLTQYLTDHFTVAERRRLSTGDHFDWQGNATQLARRVAAAAWIAAPLEDGPSAAARRGTPDTAGTARDAAALVRILLAHGGSLPVSDLPAVLPTARITPAVRTALEQCWIFATLWRNGRDEPVLTLWPPAVARLTRTPADAPDVVSAADAAVTTVLVDDMTALLVAAATEPLRLRGTDAALFARTAQRIGAALTPLPPAVLALADWNDDTRLHIAVRMLILLGLAAVKGHSGRDLRLEPAPSAQAWLAAPLEQRLRPVLDAVRLAFETREGGGHLDLAAYDYAYDEEDEYDFDPAVVGSYRAEGAAGHLDRGVLLGCYVSPSSLAQRMNDAALAAFARLPEDGVVDMHLYLDHECGTHCPLTDDPPRFASVGGARLEYMTDEERETLWQRVLAHILLNWLLPLGGLRVTLLDHAHNGIGLTSLGSYILGRTPDVDVAFLERGSADGAPRIVVQPNFDVVFLTPAPAAEAEIGRFAQRTGSRVGTLFRITRDSITAAAAAGLECDTVLDALRRVSSQPLPANVEREVRGWFGAIRRVRTRVRRIVECQDEETLARVLAAAGSAARRIGPLVVELEEGPAHVALVKKLRKQGIFVDDAGGATAPTRRGGVRNRR